MVTAYVLITTEGKNTAKILEKILKIKNVKQASAITGPYDIIAEVEGEDLNSLGAVVLSKIRAIEDVETTLTCIKVDV